MWDYMVLAGAYRLEGADLVIENQTQGRTTLQVFLEFYGREGFELVSTHFTPGWAVVIMKRPQGGAAAPAGSAFSAQQPSSKGPVLIDDDGQPVRRRKPDATGRPAVDTATPRRGRADLDRLYRDS